MRQLVIYTKHIFRTKSRRRDVSLRDQSRQVSGNINEQSEEALDMEFLRKEVSGIIRCVDVPLLTCNHM